MRRALRNPVATLTVRAFYHFHDATRPINVEYRLDLPGVGEFILDAFIAGPKTDPSLSHDIEWRSIHLTWRIGARTKGTSRSVWTCVDPESGTILWPSARPRAKETVAREKYGTVFERLFAWHADALVPHEELLTMARYNLGRFYGNDPEQGIDQRVFTVDV